MTENNSGHTVVVGCLVKNGTGEILLIRHHKRGWEIPQGRVEEGESLTNAAHREILEETGATIELGPLAAIWSKLTPPGAIIFTFIASYRSGELRPSDETPEVGWFTGEEALSMITHPVNKDRLQTLLCYSGTTSYRAYSSSPYQVLEETEF